MKKSDQALLVGRRPVVVDDRRPPRRASRRRRGGPGRGRRRRSSPRPGRPGRGRRRGRRARPAAPRPPRRRAAPAAARVARISPTGESQGVPGPIRASSTTGPASARVAELLVGERVDDRDPGATGVPLLGLRRGQVQPAERAVLGVRQRGHPAVQVDLGQRQALGVDQLHQPGAGGRLDDLVGEGQRDRAARLVEAGGGVERPRQRAARGRRARGGSGSAAASAREPILPPDVGLQPPPRPTPSRTRG